MNLKVFYLLIIFISLPGFAKLDRWDQYPSSQMQYLTTNSQFKKLYLVKGKKNSASMNQLVIRSRLNTGKYKKVKDKLDHSYHGIYTPQRQKFHDQIIDKYLKGMKMKRGAKTRVIFTAGPMGVGKGYALGKLKECTYPRGDFVTVDPDAMKNYLPEFKEQINLRKKLSAEIKAGAAGYVHKESGYLAEIVQEVALNNKLNIIVDGSLKDYGWNRMLMQKFKKKGYNVEIVYVNANTNEILNRVKKRAKETGRDIPKQVVLTNINDVSTTVKRLSSEKGLVNRLVEVDNEKVPRVDLKNVKFPLTPPSCKAKVEKFLRVKP